MSVVGIDLGNDGMVIGAASGQGQSRGKGGIDIVLNEASHRRTQTLISFQNNQRYIGESAANLMSSNLRNTVTSIKRFIGCKYDESIVQEEITTSGVKIVKLNNGRIGFEVNINDEKTEVFTPEQLLAMLLYRVKEITDLFNGSTSKSFDVVLSVPPYYTESQRRAVINSCSISGIKCLRLLNENICSAVTYGIYRSHQGLFDEKKPQYVMFIDMGQASCYASIVAFVTGKLKVISTTFDRHLGGRDIDNIIVDIIAGEFDKKYNFDVKSNKKSLIKLKRAAETAKKNLSPLGITKTTINIECLYEDYDYNGNIELSTLISLINKKDIDKKLVNVVNNCINQFKKIEPNEKISSYEIIGGSLRIPFFKELLSNTLNLDKTLLNYGLSTTLNMDECVATGAGWLSAILSPRFRIKEYIINDLVHFPVSLTLTGCDKTNEVISTFPTDLTVNRLNNAIIKINAEYDKSCHDDLPTNHEINIGEYQIMSSSDVLDGTPVIIRIDFDPNGLLNIRAISRYNETYEDTIEEFVDEEPSKIEKKEDEKKEEEKEEEKKEDEKKEDKPKKIKVTKKVQKTRTQTKIYEIKYTEYYKINPTSISIDEIKEFRSIELKMRQQDQEIRDRSARRNDLESFIYNTKNIFGSIGTFGTIEEKYSLQDKLQLYGDWLYSDEGNNATKVDFETRLHDLKSLASPMLIRKDECEGRTQSTKEFKDVIEQYRRERSEPFRSQLLPLLKEYELWLDEKLQLQGNLNLYDEPILKVIDIVNKKKELVDKCELIMNPPKPKEEEKKDDNNKETINSKESKDEKTEEEKIEEEKKEPIKEVPKESAL